MDAERGERTDLLHDDVRHRSSISGLQRASRSGSEVLRSGSGPRRVDTGCVQSPLPTWRYALLPAVALLYPMAWLVHSGERVSAAASAIVGVSVTGLGAWVVSRVHGRPTREVARTTANGWTVVIAGAIAPTFVLTGWMPSRRPYRRPDLEVGAWSGRLALGALIVLGLYLMFRFIVSPRRSEGWLQRWLARQWGHGLCPACGMAIYYAPPSPCHYCGWTAEDETVPSR